jgi:hypothetical protein
VTAPAQVPVERPRFAVQVAAFDDRPSAEALASRFSEQFGLQTLVAPVESHGATRYRVRILVGSKDDADKLALTLLRTENLRVWIVPLSGRLLRRSPVNRVEFRFSRSTDFQVSRVNARFRRPFADLLALIQDLTQSS